MTTHKCLQSNKVLIYFLIQLPNNKSLVQMKMKQINAGEPSNNAHHCKCWMVQPLDKSRIFVGRSKSQPFLAFCLCVWEWMCLSVWLSHDLVLGTKTEWRMCNDFFISLHFKNYGWFVGLFHIYRRQAGPTVHRTTNNHTLFEMITQWDWIIMW